jgi:membrane protease YdiL (CAAX protease family)
MNRRQHPLLLLAATLVLAFLLWYLIFMFAGGNFWLKLALSSLLLAVLALVFLGRERRRLLRLRLRHVVLGIGTAVALYGLFWLGRQLFYLVLPVSRAAIASVYAPRQSLPLWLIALLLLLVTGPAEEIYWRGLVQGTLARRWGGTRGLVLAAAAYALVHVWTLNLPLIAAAFCAGLCWGYLFLRENSLMPVIVSHSLWGVLVFVLLPLA